MTVPENALKKWEKACEFALGLPGAAELRGGAEYRCSLWGETVAKADKRVFVSLGIVDGSHPLGVTVRLKDVSARALRGPSHRSGRQGSWTSAERHGPPIIG